uniref:Carm_PH domain-containing protein n=1 Tax=Rhabditophanes sp. KR3021 TaxID=114890 RepID=A0AC35TFJ2_9BILA
MSLSSSGYNEICDYIKEHPTSLFGSKYWNVRFVTVLQFSTKQDKIETKFFVISKFRLFILHGKGISNLKIDKSFNILSVRAISLTAPNQVTLTIEESNAVIKKYYIKTEKINGEAIQENILSALKHYFPDIGNCIENYLELDEGWKKDFDNYPNCFPSLPCRDFRRSYAAVCDLYDQPFKDEVVWDIEKIYSASSISVLRLEDFTHLHGKDVAAIVSVLQFSAFFDGISVDSVRLSPELTEAILSVVRRSPYFKSIVLKNCSLTKDFLINFGNHLRLNRATRLETLDLSGNTFDDKKAFSILGNSLAEIDTLHHLFLANTMSEKSLEHFSSALVKALPSGASLTLRTLVLANNHIKDDVKDFLNVLSLCPKLRTLDLTETQFPLEKLFPTIASTNLINSLEYLILANTTISKKAKDNANEIKELFSSFSSLCQLSFAYSPLPSEIWTAIITGLRTNNHLTGLVLNVCGAIEKGSSVLKCHIDQLKFVTELNLRDNSLDADWIQIIAATGRMPILRKLDIGGSTFAHLKKGSKQTSTILSDTLLELTKMVSDDVSPLEELIMSDCRLGSSLNVLMNNLGWAKTLKVLDLSNNELREYSVRLLSKSLQVNTSLRTIAIDRNQITGEGFMDIAHGLSLNHQLIHIPYPINDLVEAMAKPDRNKVVSALALIEAHLHRNRVKKEKETLKCHTVLRRLQHKISYLSSNLSDGKKHNLNTLHESIVGIKDISLVDISNISTLVDSIVEKVIPSYEKELLSKTYDLRQLTGTDFTSAKLANNPVKVLLKQQLKEVVDDCFREFKWHNISDMCDEYLDKIDNKSTGETMARVQGSSTPFYMPNLRNGSLTTSVKSNGSSSMETSLATPNSPMLMPLNAPMNNLNRGRPKAPRNLKDVRQGSVGKSPARYTPSSEVPSPGIPRRQHALSAVLDNEKSPTVGSYNFSGMKVPVLPPLTAPHNERLSPADSPTEDLMSNSSNSYSSNTSNSLKRNLGPTSLTTPMTPPPIVPRRGKAFSTSQASPPQLPPKPGNIFTERIGPE